MLQNKAQTPDGVLSLSLKEGVDGRSMISLKGRGGNLDMPLLPLTQDTAVVIQLKNSIGYCWEAEYSAPAIKNEPEQFKDKSD